MIRLTAILAILLIAIAPTAMGQDNYVHSLELDGGAGYVLPTSSFFRGDNAQGFHFGAMAEGNLRWNAAASSQSLLGRSYPGLRLGVGVKGLTLFRPSLTGTPFGLFVFEGMDIHRFSPELTLSAEWEFGATAPWQIASAAHPDQSVNGSPVCAFLGASLQLRYNPQRSPWTFIAGLDLAHYSNGNTRFPNAGTNTAALRLGVARRVGESRRGPRLPMTFFPDSLSISERDRWGVELLAYGAWRKKCFHDADDEAVPFPGIFGVAGVNIAATRRLNHMLRAGVSLDLVYDESAVPSSHILEGGAGDQPYYIRPKFMAQTAAGLSVQGELMMPLFSINVGLGYNPLAGCAELRYFYQTLALRTNMTDRVWLNVGYSIRNFIHPRHLMLGVGFRFGNLHGRKLCYAQ